MTDDSPSIATAIIDRYGVMGYPVAHSRSPLIHRLFAEQTGQDMHYGLFQVTPEKLDRAVHQFQRSGGKGLNITVPHKSEVARLVDEVSDRAATAGAVNTLTFEKGQILGDNTDGVGLLRDLAVNLGVPIGGTRILILGAGGATRGIIGPLLEMRPESLRIANRKLATAQALVDHFSHYGPIAASHFDAVPDSETYDLIINATSAGLKGETPSYPASAISENTFCYDLSYSAEPTPFCKWARESGAAQSVMGWGMLVEQGAASFDIWRGVHPDTGPVLEQIRATA